MDESKKKYKVLLPTNGYEVGSEVELTEKEAADYNGGEASPRVVPVESAPADAGTGEEAKAEETKPADAGAADGAGTDGAPADAGTGEAAEE